MTGETPTADETTPGKRRGRSLALAAVLLLAGGGAGFGLVATGLIGATGAAKTVSAYPEDKVAFVPIEPLVISVGSAAAQRHLRFRAQLEVEPGSESKVELVLPRVMDILNSYLRAVDLADIENPASLVTLRAQMLRRIQIVVGEGMVNDLLVSEFVLN